MVESGVRGWGDSAYPWMQSAYQVRFECHVHLEAFFGTKRDAPTSDLGQEAYMHEEKGYGAMERAKLTSDEWSIASPGVPSGNLSRDGSKHVTDEVGV